MLLGILLDTYQVLKRRMRLKGWVISLIDLIYWIGSACLVFTLLLWSNWGELRFYIFMAICIGFLLYFQLLHLVASRWIQLCIQGVEWSILVLYQFCQYFLWIPVVKISKILLGFISLFTVVPLRWIFQPLIIRGQTWWQKLKSKPKKEK